MTVSMTGFASLKGQGEGYSWAWDLRSVNGRGLDLRLRLPDWIDGLEGMVRASLAAALHRGNVSLTLKLVRDAGEGAEALRVNPLALRAALAALAEVEAAARATGLALSHPGAAEVLLLRGVLDSGPAAEAPDTQPLRAALMADLPALLAAFDAMRAREGAALGAVIAGQLDRIEALVADAAQKAAARREAAGTALREALARVLSAAEGVDETRLAQELALIAVKADVTEEIDRLRAHVAAARELMASDGPAGRKLDFLTQEFMREANTLCAKTQALALTRIGLDLKTVIDQMREQVQNVE